MKVIIAAFAVQFTIIEIPVPIVARIKFFCNVSDLSFIFDYGSMSDSSNLLSYFD